VFPSFPCASPCVLFYLLSSLLPSFLPFLVWDLLALSLQIPTLVPIVLASLTKHPRNVTQKETGQKLPVEVPSHEARGQDLTIAGATILTTHIPQTSHPHISTKSHAAFANTRRLEGPTGQPSTQAEVFATNTAAPNLPPSSS
jgi:hypothetical protein